MSKLLLAAAGTAAVVLFANEEISVQTMPPMLMVLPIVLAILVGVLVVSTR